MANKIRLRGGAAAGGAAVNPVLDQNEIAVETDTGKFKIGDGVTHWNDLPYGGLKGDQGKDIVWLNTNDYLAGEPCFHNVKWWTCKAANGFSSTVVEPGTDENYWEEQITAPGSTYNPEAYYQAGQQTWHNNIFWKYKYPTPSKGNEPVEGDFWTVAKIEHYPVLPVTVGSNIAGPIFGYLGSDSKFYPGDNRELLKSIILGCAITDALTDETTYLKRSGPVDGFTGLVAGTDYYLGNSGLPITRGSILDGEQISYLGIALSESVLDLNIQPPQPANIYVDMPLGSKVTNAISGNAWLLSHGFAQVALDNAISQSVFSVLFDKIGHTWNDLHVMAGDADLSGSSTLFYPTPPPTEDGWLTVFYNESNTGGILNEWGLGTYELTVKSWSGTSDMTSILRVRDSSRSMHTGNWSVSISNRTGAFYQGSSTSFLPDQTGYVGEIIRVRKFVPETISTEGAYAYYKIEAVTPSGETVSAQRYVWERGLSTTWQAQTLTVPHGLNEDSKNLIISIQIYRDIYGWQDVREAGLTTSTVNHYALLIDHEASDENNVVVKTGTAGLLIWGGSSWGDLNNGDNGNMRVIVIKPNLIATVSDVPSVTEINDAVDVVRTLPDPSEMAGERIYRRKGTGTGKLTYNCPSGVFLDFGDDLLSSVDHEGTGLLVLAPSGGNWLVKEYRDSLSGSDYYIEKIASGKMTIEGTLTKNNGSTSAQSFDFPLEFADTPKVVQNQYSSSYGSRTVLISRSSTAFSIQVQDIDIGALNNSNRPFDYFAIGRWRA